MIHRTLLVLLVSASTVAPPLHAQEEAPPPETPESAASPDAAERPRPCASEAHRQFDFWIGEWDVHGARGGPPGENSIAALHDGCVVRESYRNGAYSGMSMNYHDPAAGTWHQLWVDNQGLVLRLEGGWNGESMVLSNERHRITWTPGDDGTVRQLWEQTPDGGESWEVVFDGTYERRAGAAGPEGAPSP